MQKPLDEVALADTFEMWWPKLKTEVETIMTTYKSAAAVSPRKDRELLEEILGLARAGSSMLTGIDYTLRRDQPVLIPTARMLEALFAIDQDTIKRIASTHDLKPLPWLQFQLPPSPKADSENNS